MCWGDRVRLIVGSLGALALVMLIAAELFAWLLPQRLDANGFWYVRLVVGSFFLRVFQFQIGLGGFLLSVLLLAARWRRSAAVAAIVSLTLLTPFARDFVPKRPPAAGGATLRLMSMNLYFQNRDEVAILQSINDADPDVLVLVEVTPWSLSNIIQKHLLGKYEYVMQPWSDGTGTVLTRVPYRVGASAENAGESFNRSPVVFEIGGKEVALYAVHLVSPGHTWLVERNRRQVSAFAGIAKAEKRAMILAGDCNFTQLTPNAAALHRAGLRSSHELAGFGLGNTWGPRWWPALNWLPGVRIDHIWLSPELTVTFHRIGLDSGSDHRPIVADIALAGEATK